VVPALTALYETAESWGVCGEIPIFKRLLARALTDPFLSVKWQFLSTRRTPLGRGSGIGQLRRDAAVVAQGIN
jgi:hypothetical protein